MEFQHCESSMCRWRFICGRAADYVARFGLSKGRTLAPWQRRQQEKSLKVEARQPKPIGSVRRLSERRRYVSGIKLVAKYVFFICFASRCFAPGLVTAQEARGSYITRSIERRLQRHLH